VVQPISRGLNETEGSSGIPRILSGSPLEQRRALRVRLRSVGEGPPLAYLLDRQDTVVGSSDASDFVVKVSGVSRQHARISYRSERLFVEDLESKNGVFLNGRRVYSSEIRPGDWIQFGPANLRVEAVDGADLEIAVRGTPGENPKSSADEIDVDSDTDLGSSQDEAPSEWVSLIAEFAAAVFGDDHGRLEKALRIAKDRLEVMGVVACEIPWRSTHPVVLGVAGVAASDWVIGRDSELPELMREAVEVGRREDVEIAYVPRDDGDISWAVVASPGTTATAVVLAGTFVGARESRPLLIALAHLVSASHRGADRGALVREPGASELALLDDFVVGSSPAMDQLLHMIARFSRGDVPILVQGETGVGKELVARLIHATSDRSDGPFAAMNCAAIPSELLEAELFGVRRGVATGVEERVGVFEAAAGGIVFLDEIGDMPMNLQAKLLRVIQNMEVLPLGAREPVPVDVRVLSATNTDIDQEIKQGRFRRDLYFRLAGFELRVPPLRERREDIPDLLAHFMNVFAEELDKSVRGITVKTLSILENAQWPGNVRELMHEVRRMVYLCQPGEAIDSSLISASVLESASESRTEIDTTTDSLEIESNVQRLERRLITLALSRTSGNRSRAAKLLGISRNGLALKIQRLGVAE
jgi:DNA-binding NtrC family response regulator